MIGRSAPSEMDAVDDCYNYKKEPPVKIKENSVDDLLRKHPNLHKVVSILIDGLINNRQSALLEWDTFRLNENPISDADRDKMLNNIFKSHNRL